MIGEIDGVKIIATPEQYKNIKKSLEEQLEEKDKEIERLKQRLKTSNNTCNYLRNSIDKAIEYIESYNIDFNNLKFSEATITIRELKKLLDILKGEDKE